MGDIAMAVHGGAFASPEAPLAAYREGCERALAAGVELLEGGGSAVDAVVAAVSRLEDDELFDAGRGSFLDEDGVVRLDAGIMCGSSLRTGSVASVAGVPNPVTLARAVMESEHAVLVGEGASRFAERAGVTTCDAEALVIPREQERWERLGGKTDPDWVRSLFGDTVGAVAVDRRGQVASATSTGGSPLKPLGRVGDSPFVGAGLYADSLQGAASASGHGELLIPLVWCKTAVDLLADSDSPTVAANRAVAHLARLEAKGGIILVDRRGDVGVGWNTPYFSFATRGADGAIRSGPLEADDD